MELNLTPEELIAEQFKQLEIRAEPKVEDGWANFSDICAAAAKKGLTKTNVREEYERNLEKGLVEKRKWKGMAYYRVLATEAVQPKTKENT